LPVVQGLLRSVTLQKSPSDTCITKYILQLKGATVLSRNFGSSVQASAEGEARRIKV